MLSYKAASNLNNEGFISDLFLARNDLKGLPSGYIQPKLNNSDLDGLFLGEVIPTDFRSKEVPDEID